MTFRPWLDLIREEEEKRQAADTVGAEAQAWRAWGRMGIGMGEVFPVGRTYERMRIDEPDIRPTTFLKELPAWQQRQDDRAARQRERLEQAIPLPTPIPTPELPPLPEFPLADIARGFQPTDILGQQQVAFGATPGTFQQNLQQEGARRAVGFGQALPDQASREAVVSIRDEALKRGLTPQQYVSALQSGQIQPSGGGFLSGLRDLGGAALGAAPGAIGQLAEFGAQAASGPVLGAGFVPGVPQISDINRLLPAPPAQQDIFNFRVPTPRQIGQAAEFTVRDPLGAAQAEVEFGRRATGPAGRVLGRGAVTGTPALNVADLLSQGRVGDIGAQVGEAVVPELAVLSNAAPLEAPIFAGAKALKNVPAALRVGRRGLPLAETVLRSVDETVPALRVAAETAERTADEVIDAATALRVGGEPDLARVGLAEAETPLGRTIPSVEPLEVAPAQPGRARPVETVGIRGEPLPGRLRTAQEIATEGLPPAQIVSEGAGAGRLADEGAEVVASRAKVKAAETAGTLDSAAKVDLAESLAADRATRADPRKIADGIQETVARAGKICARS